MFESFNAERFSSPELREAMQDAFSDYQVPLKLDGTAFEFLMRQRGFDRASSRVAVIDGQIVAIWLVSVRGGAAYLVTSGTRSDFRGRGLARALADDCIAGLCQRDVRSLQLEVLENNDKAVALYESLGMRRIRVLDCYAITSVDTNQTAENVERVDWREIAVFARAMRDWEPTWQNDDRSLEAIADCLHCIAHSDNRGLAGFAVAHRDSGTLFQMAVRRDARGKCIGTSLISAMQSALAPPSLRIVNVQREDLPFRNLMGRFNARKTAVQFELKLELTG